MQLIAKGGTKMNEFETNQQRLDLAGLNEREEARKQEQQAQQLPADSAAAHQRGFRSFNPEGHRLIDLQKLRERDPAAFAFLVMNRIR